MNQGLPAGKFFHSNPMKDELKQLREQIDEIDEVLVGLIGRRMEIVKKVGELKKAHNITEPLDPKRFEEILETKSKKAKELGISADFVQKLFKMIHDHAVEVQKKL